MVAYLSIPDVCPQPEATVFSPAKAMGPGQRQDLALHALAGTETISRLAAQHEVSRKFIYQQVGSAKEALQEAFAPEQDEAARVLFYLPVTKQWLDQAILGLTLICHSPLRGVGEFCRDLLDWPVSIGKVHNVLQEAVQRARSYNCQQDLSAVRIGAHDEIFQSGRPVLVGADVDSTYCYLLSVEEHRDGDTWGIRLLELQDHGFHPQATIGDAGSGLRAGQALAMAFAVQLDQDLTALAAQFQFPVATLRELFNTETLDLDHPARWSREAALREQLGHHFFPISVAVAELADHTVRASSIIENLNSRLRSYFFLRRHLGPDYLALLQFFLNHRRFLRSQRLERIGKSPTELLTGRSHPHWLEMLGYARFSRN